LLPAAVFAELRWFKQQFPAAMVQDLLVKWRAVHTLLMSLTAPWFF
jgi:hypothetical protein